MDQQTDIPSYRETCHATALLCLNTGPFPGYLTKRCAVAIAFCTESSQTWSSCTATTPSTSLSSRVLRSCRDMWPGTDCSSMSEDTLRENKTNMNFCWTFVEHGQWQETNHRRLDVDLSSPIPQNYLLIYTICMDDPTADPTNLVGVLLGHPFTLMEDCPINLLF